MNHHFNCYSQRPCILEHHSVLLSVLLLLLLLLLLLWGLLKWSGIVLPYSWRALWKNRICSTTMKLRKSPVKQWRGRKPAIISSCSVLPPEIVMHDDAFNVILWTSIDICVVHDDLGWKNRTTHYNRFRRAGCSRLEYVDIRLVY